MAHDQRLAGQSIGLEGGEEQRGLRYVLDAHWPSDIVAGALVGYVVAGGTTAAFEL